MSTYTPAEKPCVLIINLDKEQVYENLFDRIYPDLFALLCTKYHAQRARSLSEAQTHLNDHHPIAVLLPDPAVTLKENSALLKQIRDYVQAGGYAIFGCSFSSFINQPVMDNFWKRDWNLDWKMGSYHRTDVYLGR